MSEDMRWKNACQRFAKLDGSVGILEKAHKTQLFFVFARYSDAAIDAMRDGDIEQLEAVLDEVEREFPQGFYGDHPEVREALEKSIEGVIAKHIHDAKSENAEAED